MIWRQFNVKFTSIWRLKGRVTLWPITAEKMTLSTQPGLVTWILWISIELPFVWCIICPVTNLTLWNLLSHGLLQDYNDLPLRILCCHVFFLLFFILYLISGTPHPRDDKHTFFHCNWQRANSSTLNYVTIHITDMTVRWSTPPSC